MLDPKYIGTYIKARRTLLDASVWDVASWTKLSPQTIHNVEGGQLGKVATLRTICNQLNIDIIKMLQDEQTELGNTDSAYRFSAQKRSVA